MGADRLVVALRPGNAGGAKAFRRDLAKYASGIHSRVRLEAATRFGQFTGPVRVLWGEDDRYFRTNSAGN